MLVLHYIKFGEFVNYLEHMSTDFYIGTRGMLRNQFEDLHQDAEGLLCSLKIGLLGLSTDVSAINHAHVSASFVQSSHKARRNFDLLCELTTWLQNMSNTYRSFQGAEQAV